jgi:ribosomal protein S6--L-glutamate ligase
MRIGLINDRPDHPTLAEVVTVLVRAGHSVLVLDDESGPADEVAAAQLSDPADVYLCKSHSPHALDLALRLEAGGVRVINRARATISAQDRFWMAMRLADAGITSPLTAAPCRLSLVREFDGPIVVKSQFSRRNDLVAFVDRIEAVEGLLDRWADEPVVVQSWVPNQGWDLKLWVVGATVYADARPTPLNLTANVALLDSVRPFEGPTARELLPQAERMAADVGRAFGLEIYGVDVIAGPDGPVVVDVNPVPGARGVPGVAESIAELVQVHARYPARPPQVDSVLVTP